MLNLTIICIDVGESQNQILNPVIIAAIIGGLVALPGFILNYQNDRLQRRKNERDEIYKKLNSFYGPIRLQLKISNELYNIFRSSIIKRLNLNEFRTLPFILDGNKLNKTEKTLIGQILEIGEQIEEIIERNAGLIDSDDLHDEMVQLGTHIKIIREAKNGNYTIGKNKLILLESKTFPDIEKQIDCVFWNLKNRLKKLS